MHTSQVGQGRYACADDRKCVCAWRWICSQSVFVSWFHVSLSLCGGSSTPLSFVLMVTVCLSFEPQRRDEPSPPQENKREGARSHHHRRTRAVTFLLNLLWFSVVVHLSSPFLFLWLFISPFCGGYVPLFFWWILCPCETTNLGFYTFVTSLPSVGLCLQVPILYPVTVLSVVRDCCDIHQHGSTKIYWKNIAHGSGASEWQTFQSYVTARGEV